ncbi:hypothetical protein GTQ40_07005 [Flavobacteriaceae bacterium R38]|nr:hypothetical protein [Flavobacteriaceae bacterium R38]
MKCSVKIIISIIVTIILTFGITALIIEYSIQNDKYGDDVVQITIRSEIMKEERPIIVHLPESYTVNTNKKYPVMYVLDGTSQDNHTTVKIDIFSKVELFPEAIVVSIPNTRGNRSRDQTPHYMKIDLDKNDSKLGNGNNFLNFIENELITYINANYRTNGFQTLSGNSRGGLFTFYAMLENPTLFNAYVCYSPAFWRENSLIVKKAKVFFDQNSIVNTTLFMSLGALENDKMKSAYKDMTKLIENQKFKGFNFKHQITDHANHQNNSYKSTIYALKWLGTVYEPFEEINL